MKIVNLTQHAATKEQLDAGVVDVVFDKTLLNFVELPNTTMLYEKAIALAEIAKQHGATHALIGGAPYLMSRLESVLKAVDITPVYAFTLRESVEVVQEDGSVVKTAIFRHKGFVEV